MLQELERREWDAGDIHGDHPGLDRGSTREPLEAKVVPDDGLLRVAGPLMGALYAVALGAAVLTFRGSGEALFAAVISIGFAVVYFTVPILMVRVRARHDARWRRPGRHDATDRIQTFTGDLKRWEAVLQVVIVPAAVAFGFVAFGLIWTFATH